LSGLGKIGAGETSGSAQESPGRSALKPLFGTGGTVFFGGLVEEVAVGGGGNGAGRDGGDEVAVGGGAIESAGEVEPFGGVDERDVLRHAAGEGDGEDAGTGSGKDAIGRDGLVAVAVSDEESEVVAFVIGDSSGSAGVRTVLESGDESVAAEGAVSGEIGSVGVHGNAGGISGTFGPDESGKGTATGRGGRGGSGGGVGIRAEVISGVGGTDAVSVGGGRSETGVVEGSGGRGSNLRKVGAAGILAALDQVGRDAYIVG